ncbi:MAG: hypothetical protein QM730_02775 [Anaerolineales bacterium]
MKKTILLVLVILFAGCSLVPTPDDFPPPPPMTVIVEFPQVTATTTIEPNVRPILPDDMQEAEMFFLIIKTAIMAGDDTGIAERVHYPLYVRSSGQEIVLKNSDEFLANYQKIFDSGFVTTLSAIDESSLTLSSNGIQVGNGEVWLNYFCVDLACSESQFLITQINR